MVRGNFWADDIPAHGTLLINVSNDKGETHDLFKRNKFKAAEMITKPEKFKAAEMITKPEKFKAALKVIPPVKIPADGSAGD